MFHTGSQYHTILSAVKPQERSYDATAALNHKYSIYGINKISTWIHSRVWE